MEREFYYADMDLTVVVKDNKTPFMESLTKEEQQVLQLTLWHALNGFITCRALYAQCLIDHDKT